MSMTLEQYLHREVKHGAIPSDLMHLMLSTSYACKHIASLVRRGALAGVLGMAGSENVQGEDQKKLDVMSNDIFVDTLMQSGVVAGLASEEMDDVLSVPESCELGRYLVAFDPLDGSSNIDINSSIGSIFSVLETQNPSRTCSADMFLRPGREQVAAGYCMYGPQTQLVFTFGKHVTMFTLDPNTGDFILTIEKVEVPASTKEFAINMSNMRHWEAPVKRYVEELLAGETSVRGKNFNMRWIAAMVAEVHRILQRGGIFMYPKDARDPSKPGKLRLLYEANPMSLLMEAAGARATNGHERILDMQPEKLHQRVAVFLGAQEEVDLVTSYHK